MGTSKVMTATEAIKDFLSPDATVAIGGMHMHNNPMALVREIVRQKVAISTLVLSPSASMNADLPIGAGLVKEVLAPYIGFEHLGMAPCFRRAVEDRSLKVRECETSLIINGLRAGGAGVPFHPVAMGVARTSIPELNKEDYKFITDPFSGSQVLCTQALNPDVAMVHCHAADKDGNAVFGGSVFSDWDMIRASSKTIIQVERVVGTEDLAKVIESRAGEGVLACRSVPGIMVDAIVPVEFGCHPTSSHGSYLQDEDHLIQYLEMARTKDGFKEYIERYVSGQGEAGYLGLVGPKVKDVQGSVLGPTKGTDGTINDNSIGPTIIEIMMKVLAMELSEDETAIMGANSSIPLLACMLAKATHAPGLNYLTGGSGAVSPDPGFIPLSSCDQRLLISSPILELGDLIDSQTLSGGDVFFAGGLQVDRKGNLNLIGVGPQDGPTFRGPGTAGLSIMASSKRIVVYMTHHTKRQFVEKVDHISGTGRPYNNVVKVVSPLGVFDFDEDDHMKVQSLHPGVKLKDVHENSAFKFETYDQQEVTPLPSEEDLEVMRRLDPFGSIRKG